MILFHFQCTVYWYLSKQVFKKVSRRSILNFGKFYEFGEILRILNDSLSSRRPLHVKDGFGSGLLWKRNKNYYQHRLSSTEIEIATKIGSYALLHSNVRIGVLKLVGSVHYQMKAVYNLLRKFSVLPINNIIIEKFWMKMSNQTRSEISLSSNFGDLPLFQFWR